MWDIDDSVLMNHITKDEHQEILFQSDDPWTTPKNITKPYIVEHLNNINVFQPQYITSIIKYGPYI